MRSENHTTRPCTLSLDELTYSMAAFEQPFWCQSASPIRSCSPPPPAATSCSRVAPTQNAENACLAARQSQVLNPSALEPASSASPSSPIKIAPCMNVAAAAQSVPQSNPFVDRSRAHHGVSPILRLAHLEPAARHRRRDTATLRHDTSHRRSASTANFTPGLPRDGEWS